MNLRDLPWRSLWEAIDPYFVGGLLGWIGILLVLREAGVL